MHQDRNLGRDETITPVGLLGTPGTPGRDGDPAPPAPRIAVVLGSGGFRGPAHVGVLSRLRDLRVPLHAMVGCSVGSLVAAYYGAVGLDVEGLLENALQTTPLGVLAHALTLWLGEERARFLGRWAGPVRARLALLDRSDFRNLHHGLGMIGFLIHDRRRGERIFVVTGRERGFRLSEAVRASSRLPLVFPTLRKEVEGLERHLVDGAFSAPSPVIHAVAAPVSATHVLVVDLTGSRRRARHSELSRWQALLGDRLLIVRPRPSWRPARWGSTSGVIAWHEAGRRAIGEREAARLRSWLGAAAPVRVAAVAETVPVG
ncbi:MAG TPA: patatin-like phospholipase family protein [Candidatus Polarisedimenticolia bacterium]|nr:patatin-like phospholipase family protein [Candidatus Polarisedimenticolia bacterium]